MVKIRKKCIMHVVFACSVLLFPVWIWPTQLELVHAQVVTDIVSDGTLPTPTQVTPDGLGGVVIDKGTVRGSNLFHSFDRFSVGTGSIASFVGPPGGEINNVLTRVTGRISGAKPSVIDGILQSTIPGANFFLMNPEGIMFGPNASLDIGNSVGTPGSFFATTADYLGLGGGVLFSAVPDAVQDNLLRTAPVEAFGFLDENPALISASGSFGLALPLGFTPETAKGETLGLIGGDISIDSSFLFAPSGEVQIASVRSPGELVFDSLNTRANVNGDTFHSFGVVDLTNGSVLEVSDQDAAFGFSAGDGHGGAIVIRAGKLIVQQGSLLSSATFGFVDSDPRGIEIGVQMLSLETGGAIQSASQSFLGGNGKAADVNISGIDGPAEFVILDGESFFGPTTSINSTSLSPGDSGSISISSKDLALSSGATILTQALDAGNGGNIVANVNRLEMTGGGQIETQAQAFGQTGNIWVRGLAGAGTFAELLSLHGTSSDGRATSIRSLSGGTSFSSTGDISIRSQNVILSDGGSIRGLNGGNAPKSGALVVDSPNGLTISGISDIDGSPSGLFNTNSATGGIAGDIRVTSATILVSDGGEIRSGSESNNSSGGTVTLAATESVTISHGSGVSSLATDQDVGDVSIIAHSFVLENGFIETLTKDSGKGGDIRIQGDHILIHNQGRVDSSTSSTGDGGNISISANEDFSLEANGLISASSTSHANDAGLSGGITLFSGGDLEVQSSSVKTSGQQAAGGNVVVRADDILSIVDGSVLSAQSQGEGPAGTVRVSAGNELWQSSSTVSSSAQRAAGGSVMLSAGRNISLLEQSVVSAETKGLGNAGTVEVSAGGDLIQSGGIVTSSAQEGAGGDVMMTAGHTLSLLDEALVSAETQGPGNAGTIRLEAEDTIFLDKSRVSTLAAEADGGNIKLAATELIHLIDSRITSSVGGGVSTVGGNIDLDPKFIILQNSQILANAFEGQGGNITLTGDVVFVDSTSTLSASSALGINGKVDIQAPIQYLSGTLAPLPQNPVSVATLYASSCVAQQSGQYSSFVNAIPQKIATIPGQYLPSPLLLVATTEEPIAILNPLDGRHTFDSDDSIANHSTQESTLVRVTPLPRSGEFKLGCPL